MAVAESGMGIVEDKVIKNHFASEYIYNAYKDEKPVAFCLKTTPSVLSPSLNLSALSAVSFRPLTQLLQLSSNH
jgi:hypothetical protein